jgi:hypothetical protein
MIVSLLSLLLLLLPLLLLPLLLLLLLLLLHMCLLHKRYHERKQNLSYHPQTMEFQLQRRGVCTFVPCHLPGQKNTLALTVAARHVGTRPSTQQSRKM